MLCLVLLSDVLRLRLSCNGHDKKISEIGASCAAQTGVCETVDAVVAVVISRTGIPIVDAGVGAGLYHAVWDHGSRVGVSMSAGTDIQIHGILCLASCEYYSHEGERKVEKA